MTPTKFIECESCAAKPGMPVLCAGCLNNRELISDLERRATARTDSFLAVLRAANLSRVVRFGHGDIKAPHGWGPMQWGCALAGEVGELCNFLKKYERQMPSDPTPDELFAEIAKEIADVFIYLDLLASTFDLDLARIIASKFNATSKKFGFPERL